MSNERFDNLMKKNLDSLRPAYQPRAWDRFRRRLPVAGFWPWFIQFGGWGISGLMLAGWLLTLYTLHANQQVLTQLSQRRSALISPVALPPKLSSGNRVDTVYIVKRTVIEHRYYTTSPDDGTNADRQIVSRSRKRVDRTNPSSARSMPAPSTSEVSLQTQSPQSYFPPTAPGHSSTKEATHEDKAVSNTPARIHLIPDPASGQDDSIRKLNETVSADSATTDLDSVTQKPAMAPPLPAPPTSQSRPRFKLASLQPRLGIETMATPSGFGAGPVFEVFPIDNLGFSLGLQASQFRLENHRGLTDFNAATGQNFVEQYRAFLPAQYDKIEDISIQTSVINVPIRLNYYIPLRQRWALIIQAGTRLDVAAYQQVRYESYLQTDEQYHSFEVHAAHRLFHNFLFGAGFQYRKPRLTLQVAPYYVYDFRSIINTPAGSNFGLKASVWLDLFK